MQLWTINKRVIDPVCPRHAAVLDAGRVRMTLTDGPDQPEAHTVPKHKKFEGAGVKITMRTKVSLVHGCCSPHTWHRHFLLTCIMTIGLWQIQNASQQPTGPQHAWQPERTMGTDLAQAQHAKC